MTIFNDTDRTIEFVLGRPTAYTIRVVLRPGVVYDNPDWLGPLTFINS